MTKTDLATLEQARTTAQAIADSAWPTIQPVSAIARDFLGEYAANDFIKAIQGSTLYDFKSLSESIAESLRSLNIGNDLAVSDFIRQAGGLGEYRPRRRPVEESDEYEVTDHAGGIAVARRRGPGRPKGTRRKWLDREALIEKFLVCRRGVGRAPSEAEFVRQLGWSRTQLWIVLRAANLDYQELIEQYRPGGGSMLSSSVGRQQRGPNQGQSQRRSI